MRWLILLFSVGSISACYNNSNSHISQADLLEQINQQQAPIIIDVRSDHEFKLGHLPGAVHIPFWTAFSTDKLTDVPKQNELVLYCAHGPRAGVVKLALYFAGFENMRYLDGHMTAWDDAELPQEINLTVD